MNAIVTPNDYIDQIRFRIREREGKFKDGVNSLYSEAGATGQIGALRANLFAKLRGDFDAEIQEALSYLGRTLARSALDPRDTLGLTSQLLGQSAIAFKAIIDVERLTGFFSGEHGASRTLELATSAFAELDQLLHIRLTEFSKGLHDDSPWATVVPAADRYVAISHNEREAVVEELHGMQRAVEGSNEGNDEERLVALSEIAAFEATILQPRVSSDLIQRFVDTVLAWIMRTFSLATIQEVAQRLVQALLKLIAPPL